MAASRKQPADRRGLATDSIPSPSPFCLSQPLIFPTCRFPIFRASAPGKEGVLEAEPL
jgi:hypothetical protein